MDSLPLLLIESDDDSAKAILHSLVVPGVSFEPHRITSDAEFREAIASAKYGVIISELKNPKYDAVKAFARLRGGQIMTPFIVVSKDSSEESAVECLSAGVTAYLSTENLPRLSVTVRRAINERRIERSNSGTDDALREAQEDFRGLVEASTEFIWTAAEDGTSSDLYR